MLDIARNLSASASVHALTGSSRPGHAPTVTLGIAAAHPDAAVIDLAGRVKRLAERNYAHQDRTQRIRDRISAQHPSATRCAGRTATQEEFEAHCELVRQLEERLGLPQLQRLGRRMMSRLVRWTRRLAVLEPATMAGLGAKASAVLAVREADRFDLFTDDVAEAVNRDAVRLASVPREAADTELFALLAQHDEAEAAYDLFEQKHDLICEAWIAACPPRPDALRWHHTDPSQAPSLKQPIEGTEHFHLIYDGPAIEELRASPDPIKRSETREPMPDMPDNWIVRTTRSPDAERIARKVEILAAWDGWIEAKEALKGPMGLTEANAVLDALFDAWGAIDEQILAYRPATLAGLQAKAAWIKGRTNVSMLASNFLDEVMAFVPLGSATPRQSNLRPAPLPSGILVGRYPAGTSREDIETYRTFLDMELRYLNWEIYGRTEGRLHLWMDNPAADLHGPGQPPASSRAAAVLTLLGIMPTTGVDGQAQAEALARAASAA